MRACLRSCDPSATLSLNPKCIGFELAIVRPSASAVRMTEKGGDAPALVNRHSSSETHRIFSVSSTHYSVIQSGGSGRKMRAPRPAKFYVAGKNRVNEVANRWFAEDREDTRLQISCYLYVKIFRVDQGCPFDFGRGPVRRNVNQSLLYQVLIP